MERSDNKEKRKLSIFILIFVIMSASIVTTGYIYYRMYENYYRAEVELQLSAIEARKIKRMEVKKWRSSRQNGERVGKNG